MENRALLGREWQTLQENHERHEKNALLIKLVCLSLCLIGLATKAPVVWLGLTVLLCWIQEGVFKTYQGRLAARLLCIESRIRAAPDAASDPMQLHSDWSLTRPTNIGLIAGYAASACKPTVAFPYLPLLIALGLGSQLHWI